MKRGLLNKDLQKALEFIVEYKVLLSFFFMNNMLINDLNKIINIIFIQL